LSRVKLARFEEQLFALADKPRDLIARQVDKRGNEQ